MCTSNLVYPSVFDLVGVWVVVGVCGVMFLVSVRVCLRVCGLLCVVALECLYDVCVGHLWHWMCC